MSLMRSVRSLWVLATLVAFISVINLAAAVAGATEPCPAACANCARACLREAFHAYHLQDRKVFSQLGEDGVIEAIFRCIGTTSKYYVEFGTETGSECSTRNLRENHNWTGLLMDGGNENAAINLHKEFMTSDNIAELFRKYNVPMQFDHMTVDLDINTFWVAQAALVAGYRPRSLIIEINRNFYPLHQSYVSMPLPTTMWNGNCYFGASPLAVARLAQAFGYVPLTIDLHAINMFFVHKDAIGGLVPLPSEQARNPHSHAILDVDFNLPAIIETMSRVTKCEPEVCHTESLHGDCQGMDWLRVDANADLTLKDPVPQLKRVTLSHRNRLVPVTGRKHGSPIVREMFEAGTASKAMH